MGRGRRRSRMRVPRGPRAASSPDKIRHTSSRYVVTNVYDEALLLLDSTIDLAMGGSEYDDDWELPTADITLVLVGKLGCGKSATGNSILGSEAFLSEYSHASVTNTCKMASTTLMDGRRINVIDTPGLFDVTTSFEDAGKEIVKCMNMAKDGIHAVLMVFNATSRFSREDSSTIETIKEFFGEKIVDHMILVFTYGDLIGESKLKSMLNNAPENLQKIVELCQNRVVLMDNMTKDRKLQQKQLEKLLDVVDSVSTNNGGRPFSDQMLTRIKEVHARRKEVHDAVGYTEEQISELKEEISRARDEQLAHITSMVEEKLNITVDKLQQQLKEEQIARLEAEKRSQQQLTEEQNARLESERRSDEEIRKLKKRLEAAQRENEEFRKMAQNNKCSIL
uniref:AIG1-type G domain-containing protein n=1 Tax=Leersia perrieri TaxID=77586 RepID=A0A0D9VH36_9ORYZ